MTENEIGTKILKAAIEIHHTLGPGLLESVYESILARELIDLDLQVQRQVPINVRYKNMVFQDAFRADLIVGRKVVVEIKSVEITNRIHKKQLITYLRLSDMKLGYLLNFGEATLKDVITRIVNRLTD